MDVKSSFHLVVVILAFNRIYGDITYNDEKKQRELLIHKKIECIILMNVTENNNFTDSIYCPPIWDRIMCWPQTEAGRIASQPCPYYINKFKRNEIAFRECLSNGTWLDPRPNGHLKIWGWTNYSRCVATENRSYPKSETVVSLVTKHQDAFRLMYNIGYFLSLVSLLLAIFIMLFFRKLHCARNYIHMNLFLSFILRAAVSVIKENAWEHHLGFPSDVETLPNGTVVYTDGPHWECRLFFTLYKYVLVASYMWIFMEAVYIHMVIFVSVFTEKTRVIWYIIIGWALPLPFVISWAISRAVLDNTYCWHLSESYTGIIWLIQAPVMITVILNFVFFINIVRVLLTKLNTFPNSDTNRYRTLAKSIVVLIPLFGVYYILVVIPTKQVDTTTSFIMLIIEMFFNSYQGLFIAILLCFTNAEVRTEIRKSWHRFSLRRMSTVSRASQMYPTNTSRSMSTTRLSDVSRVNSAFRRRQSSDAENEQTVPFTNTLITINDDENEHDKTKIENIEICNATKAPAENGSAQFNPDKLKLKINVVNIECKSRDGISTYTTSLDIEALKNGRTVSAENILNNNIAETTYTVPNDDGMLYMDEKD
ncbi:secretin receptor-like [Ruditapes philippinarum]|uniref:secretin receptor-like n=1 Tax=Ruditapes philippinarum TaxID=129788 RepID=UPI00295B6D15|nr:secretin receptor-like [Ruditapes philippinarum]